MNGNSLNYAVISKRKPKEYLVIEVSVLFAIKFSQKYKSNHVF